MSGPNPWRKKAESAQSLSELRQILESENPLFKKAAQDRRAMEAKIDHIRMALKRTRIRVRVGQVALAKTMGTTQSSISTIEKGHGDLGMITVLRYLDGLNVDPASWFLDNARELADSNQPAAEAQTITDQPAKEIQMEE